MDTRGNATRLAAWAVAMGLAAVGCNTQRTDWDPGPRGLVVPQEDPIARTNEPIEIGPDEREVDLVEAVLTHRADYHRSLRRLNAFYVARGFANKAEWAAFELRGLQHVKRFRYVLDAEVPDERLQAVDSIAEADELYEEGVRLMREGGHGIPLLYRQDRMIEATRVLRRLIEQYSSSDKIDDAAFLLGEMHKEYFEGQERIAMRWYERAWTWNPNTPHPARFQAAVVADYRLHDRARALELYREVIRHEKRIPSNSRWAARRIHELSRDTRARRVAGRG